MKKLLLVVVVAALALTLVPLALAGAPGGGGWKHGHAKFNLVGKVVSVDATTASETSAGTMMIITVKGGTNIKGLRKTDAPFTVATDAKVWLLTEDGAIAGRSPRSPRRQGKARGVITGRQGRRTTTVTYTIKNLKYKDLTPDEVTPPVTLSPDGGGTHAGSRCAAI